MSNDFILNRILFQIISGLDHKPNTKINFQLSNKLNCTFRKIFSTRSQEVVDGCKQIFSCQTPSDAVADRKVYRVR